MDNNERIVYFEQKERMQYEHSKDIQKTLRWAILSVLGAFSTLAICITAILCCYMYYVVPVEEEISHADNGSQIIQSSTIGGNNGN